MEKRHYEILFITRHINENKAKEFSGKYRALIEKDGNILRYENWGVRPLAYNIDGLSRGLYILINAHCLPNVIEDLEKKFKFDDMILRYMVIKEKTGITEESPMMKFRKEDATHKSDGSIATTQAAPADEGSADKGGQQAGDSTELATTTAEDESQGSAQNSTAEKELSPSDDGQPTQPDVEPSQETAPADEDPASVDPEGNEDGEQDSESDNEEEDK